MSGTILIIEDDKDIRTSLEEAAQALGIHAIGAEDGQEALDLLSSIEPPCLILLDLMMPKMNGWQFRVEQQKDQRIANIPVVIISADGSIEQKADKIGAVEFLKKPFEFKDFADLAMRYCKDSQS